MVNFFSKVEQEVAKDEKAFCEAIYEQTECLVRFISKKSLPLYQRDELIFWIQTNFDTLYSNPFSQDIDMESIIDDFSLHLDKYHEFELEKLLKSTSINKLFRRLAKALHPDLIQDETKKSERHHLMIELINARKNKDIVKIIVMYTEHVGEAPQDIFDGNYEQMTQLLKNQAEQLKQDKFNIIEENPRHAVIYNRFFDPSETKVKNKLQNHRKVLKNNIRDIKFVAAKLTSLKNLKPLLQDLNEQSMLMDMDDFIFSDTSGIPF